MNLIIDIGNTLTKIFLFKDNEIITNEAVKKMQDAIVLKEMASNNIQNIIVSSVKDITPEKIEAKGFDKKKIIYLGPTTPLPIKKEYKTPETLGNDRIAAVVGANNIFPNQNVLVIDAGTAITFDFINKKGGYFGGNISPGLSMRYKALHQFTKKLPLLAPSEEMPLLGQNTAEAITAGVQNGIIYEIDAYIDNLKEKHDELEVILTGGDTFFFANKLKNRIFAQPFLVALGLNRILEYNVKNI